MSFVFKKLFLDVFNPEPDERVLVVTDTPTGSAQGSAAWDDRIQMAQAWHAELISIGNEIGFEVLPFQTYPATGAHNADLALGSGSPGPLKDALRRATAVMAPTEFSASAPMVAWSREHDDFRAATLPGIERRTEATALAADYTEVARRCAVLKSLLDPAVEARVTFSTGHTWRVDLRYHDALMDDGQLPRNKPDRIINLPSGESFQVPYEGDREGDPSLTEGEIPVSADGDVAVLKVEANRIVDVEGLAPAAQRLRKEIAEEPVRGNIAEFAFGCNPMAVVWGNVLEDEKAGFHWAYGRSEHLGGSVGPEAFSSPDRVVHQDIVYAKDSPIQVTEVVLTTDDKASCTVIRDGEYVLFSEEHTKDGATP